MNPHPGYGYIKPGEPLGAGYRVAEFKEKPDEKTARTYLEKGYLWNSGMFLFHTGIFNEVMIFSGSGKPGKKALAPGCRPNGGTLRPGKIP